LTAVDVAIDVGFVLLVPVVDALAFADDFGKGMLWLACEDMLGGDFSVGNNALVLENSLETRPKTTKSPEESLSILNGVFPVLFAGRWWVSAFGAPSIGREKGIERTCGMDAKKK
jgi:hypothetical protein